MAASTVDVAFTPSGSCGAGTPGITPRLRTARRQRRLEQHRHRGASRIHRAAGFAVLRDGQRGWATVCSASRRPARIPACPRRPYAGLRRFSRQPAIHHDRQSRRERSAHSCSSWITSSGNGSNCGGERGWSRTTLHLLERLMPEGYRARPEQAILFTLEAWDANCPQHIPRLYAEEDVARIVGELKARIAALEAQLAGGVTATQGRLNRVRLDCLAAIRADGFASSGPDECCRPNAPLPGWARRWANPG